ncbi:auxin-responsive protein SAUR32-like [Curcuma longa]|uniref:auxin-responsive protein SAUR32-like n=1 Tax=Curcuma longa TaxID=136217 RepID=UPI003D9EA9C7
MHTVETKHRLSDLKKQMMRRWRWFGFHRRQSPLASDEPPRPARAGAVPVYVGPYRERFEIPTRLLKLPAFAELLRRTEEEHGFSPAGALAIPCDPEFFAWAVSALRRDEKRLGALELDSLLAIFDDLGGGGGGGASCRDSASYDGFSPLIPKTRN